VTIAGNPALSALDLLQLATVGDDLTVADNNADGGSIDLGALTEVGGNVNVSDNTASGGIDLGGLGQVGGSVNVSNNTGSGTIDLGSLVDVVGHLTIHGNLDLTILNLNALTSVGGNVDVSDNTAAASIALPNLASVGGDVKVEGNTAASSVDLGSLQSTGGSVNVSDNTAATSVDLTALSTVGGSVNVSQNPSLLSVSIGALQSLAGLLDVSGNTAAASIDVGAVTAATSVDVSDNTAATSIDLGSLATTGGTVNVSGNTGATSIDLAGLSTVGGSVNVSDNSPSTVVNVSGLTSVAGDLTLETASPTIDVSDATVGGSIDLTGYGSTSVTGQTAEEPTMVSIVGPVATMSMGLPIGTFSSPVTFGITTSSLTAEEGLDPDGGDVMIDPLSAYQFQFSGADTLDEDAALVFIVNLEAMTSTDRATFLAALASGRATMAIKGDDLEDVYQAFEICPAEPPIPSDCVTVERLRLDGSVIPAGDGEIPAAVRFTGVTGSFSTWAAVTLSGGDSAPALDVDGDGQVEALTDGLLVLRYLFGFRGTTLVTAAVDLGACTRCGATELETHLASIAGQLDADADGGVEPLTDGLLALRYVFGFRGATLIASAVDLVACNLCEATAIETYLESFALAP
jgi:hypothetical protein